MNKPMPLCFYKVYPKSECEGPDDEHGMACCRMGRAPRSHCVLVDRVIICSWKEPNLLSRNS
jgi:hypothetical protein